MLGKMVEKIMKLVGRFLSGVNKQMYVIVLTICLIEIGFWINYQEPTRPYSSIDTQSHVELHVLIKGEEDVIESNLTNQVWNFEDIVSEKIYLYEKLLKKEHAFNRTNVKMFRNEFQLSMGNHLHNYMIIDQENTHKDFIFKFGTRKNSPTVTITEEIRKLLPHRSTFKTLPRCSVVGNSGSILSSKCGNHIDDADFVFRCNAAPIEEYAFDAGRKSNMTTFNPSIFSTRYNKFSKPDDVLRFVRDMRQYHGIIWAPCFSHTSMNLCLDVMKTYTSEGDKFVLGHPDHFKKVQMFWESRGHKGKISTGFYLTNVALSRCLEVHLYGFWPFSKMADKEDIPYHYFDKINFTSFTKPTEHNMNSEFSVLLQLHTLGVLRIHIGGC